LSLCPENSSKNSVQEFRLRQHEWNKSGGKKGAGTRLKIICEREREKDLKKGRETEKKIRYETDL
jgi:hypothetical protein